MHVIAPRPRLGSAVFREFFEADPNAVLLVDPAGRIALANRRAQELFGYGPGELEQLSTEDLIPARARDAHVEHRARFEAYPEPRRMGQGLELWATRRDGTDFPVDVALSTFGRGRDRLTCAIVVDVTEQRRAMRRQAALLAVTSRLSAALATDDVAAVVLETAASGVGAAGAALILRGAGAGSGEGAADYRRVEALFPGNGWTILERAIETRAIVADHAAGSSPLPGAQGNLTVVGLPVAAGDHILGSLGIAFRDVGRAEDLPFLELLARTSGQALDRARAYDAERRAREAEQAAREQAQALARLNAAVAKAGTSTEVARLLLDEVFLAVPTSRAAITLLDESRAEFELVGVRSSGGAVEARDRWPFDLPSPARDVVLSGRLLQLDEAGYRSRYPEVSAITDPTGIHSYLALPLVVGGQAIGAVGLTFKPPPSLANEGLAHLQALVAGGAQAIARARLEEAERTGRRLLSGVIAQMPLGIRVLEAGTLRSLYVNEAFEAIFGAAAATTVEPGPAPRPGVPEPRIPAVDGTPAPVDDPVTRAIEAGEPVADELLVVERATGKRMTVSVNAGPIRDEAGRVVAGIGVYADVTARREAEAARDAFIGVLSHELRTPITSIYAGANILAHHRPPAELAADVANDVAAEAERLHRLVEDLLVLSRVERGADMKRDDPVLLQRVIPRVARYEEARWPGRRFPISLGRGIPAVCGDESYVEQIVRNLLSNAAKYGPPDAEVETVVEQEGDEVTIRVLDRGPGIDPGEEENIFRLFHRSPSTAAAATGAGIGLYAARALAAAMGGRTWARRRETGGAEVGFALPVMPEDDFELAETSI